jgi:hypothetical protein
MHAPAVTVLPDGAASILACSLLEHVVAAVALV